MYQQNALIYIPKHIVTSFYLWSDWGSTRRSLGNVMHAIPMPADWSSAFPRRHKGQVLQRYTLISMHRLAGYNMALLTVITTQWLLELYIILRTYSNEWKKKQMDHLVSSIVKFLTTLSACFIMCGDFNDIDTRNISALFPLKQIVSFATRESITLDLVFTDIAEYTYTKLAPISTNDHCAISLDPSDCKYTPRYNTIKKGK